MRTILGIAGLIATAAAVTVPGVAVSMAALPSPGASLALSEVTHALENQTLVIGGLVRNVGRVSVSRLVIDASGYAPTGDLAAFGSDGIPWEVRPEGAERFRIFLPLERTFVSNYTVGVTGSRPAQERPAALTGTISPRFYRPLILSRVRVNVSAETFALTLTASADGLPVAAVEVSVQLLVDELKGALPDFRVLTVEVPLDRPLRMRFAPLILKVVSVTVVDARLTPTWTGP